MKPSFSITSDSDRFFSSGNTKSTSNLTPLRTHALKWIGSSAKKEQTINSNSNLGENKFRQAEGTTQVRDFPSPNLSRVEMANLTKLESSQIQLTKTQSESGFKRLNSTTKILEDIQDNNQVTDGLDRLLRMIQRQKVLMSMNIAKGEFERSTFEKTKIKNTIKDSSHAGEYQSANKKYAQELEDQYLIEEVQDLRNERQKLLQEINEIIELKQILNKQNSNNQMNRLSNGQVFEHVNKNCEVLSRTENEVIFKWKIQNEEKEIDPIDEVGDFYKSVMQSKTIEEVQYYQKQQIVLRKQSQVLESRGTVLPFDSSLDRVQIEMDRENLVKLQNQLILDQECSTCEDELLEKLATDTKDEVKDQNLEKECDELITSSH